MRTVRAEVYEIASDDLTLALREIGIDTTTSDTSISIAVDGRSRPLEVRTVAIASGPSVAAIIDRASARGLHILVSDRISADARAILDDANWSWLDRRGEISLRIGTRFFVRRAVTPKVRTVPQSNGPVRSRAGVAYLAAALELPNTTPVLRAVARRAGLSHVAISAAKTKLRDANLIDERGRAIEHITFEALSESWTSNVIALAATPNATNNVALDVNPNDPARPGWALTDTLAAIAWGATLPVTAEYPPDFIVPTQRVVDRAIHVLGRATSFEIRAATISLAPTPFATDNRYRVVGIDRLVTHPLYVALAIARDRSRGPEILAAWNPTRPEGFQRTW